MLPIFIAGPVVLIFLVMVVPGQLRSYLRVRAINRRIDRENDMANRVAQAWASDEMVQYLLSLKEGQR